MKSVQFITTVFDADGFTIFTIISIVIIITLSLISVSIADLLNQTPPEDIKLNLKSAWLISLSDNTGYIFVGMTNSAFRTVSPIYAEQIDMLGTDVVTFVNVVTIGGTLIHYQLSHPSNL